MLTVFGLVVFAALFGGVLRAQACRWRYLADAYAAEAGPALAERHMRSAVLIGLGAFNTLHGIVTIGVHRTGVSFRVMPIFSLFHRSLFVPYSEIRGWRTTWYLDAPSSELEFQKAPEVKVVLPEEDAQWIHRHAGRDMKLSAARPPQGNAGRGWHLFTVAFAFLGIFMVGWLLGVIIAR